MNEQVNRSIWGRVLWALLLIAAMVYITIAIVDVHHHHDRLIIWIAATCTLAIYTILYRENPVFRLFEHLFLGVATGYGVQVIITTIIVPKWWNPLFHDRQWYWIFALLIGVMFYFVFSKRLTWIARWAMGLVIGATAGLGIMGFVTEFIPQMKSAIKPVVQFNHSGVVWNLNNLLMFITLITVMSYFFFSIEHKRPALAGSAKLGRWLLMIAFGAIFGNTVMARVSLFIDRMQFLLVDWLKLHPPM